MSDRERVLIHRSQPDPGEPVRISVRHGGEQQRLECECALIVAATPNDDASTRTFQVMIGDVGRYGDIIVAASVNVGKRLGLLDEALAVELATDYEGTMAAIGRALVMHANWKENQNGEAERDSRDDAG